MAIMKFMSYAEWQEAARQLGGHYIIADNEGAHEGMHPSDVYATVFAYKRCDKVGRRFEHEGLIGFFDNSPDEDGEPCVKERGYLGTEEEIHLFMHEVSERADEGDDHE